jgi:energy-coupling factor transporter ATP-binding protein EcfA2
MTQTSILNNDIIKLAGSFNRSTNLELDYKSGNKISDIFITPKFSNGILEILNSVNEENSNQRVRVLSGSPGLGKSTFALLMSTLLNKSNPRTIKKLIESSEAKDTKELAEQYTKFQKSKSTKLVPVFLNGYIGNIEDAFLDKLVESFDSIGLKSELNKLIKQSSKKYWSVVEKWQKSFPEIYAKYAEEVELEADSQSAFEKSLKKGTISARDTFERIYSKVTGGSSLSTSANNDVVSIFKDAISILNENGYAGLFVVYDEFGKYLEKGIHNPSALNIQFLQDFAEFCDRSGKAQCHLTLITHLSVSQYANQLPINIQKEWAKIEGRFHETSFYDRGTTSYDMISHVFEKTVTDGSSKLAKQVKAFNKNFCKEMKGKGLNGVVEESSSINLLTNCYPLHPVTFSFLPLLSQRVAQNERTLYTFLTRDEEFGLKRFLDKGTDESELSFLMPLDLYNYFSPLIAKDVGVGGSYKINLIVEEAFGKIAIDDMASRQIVSIVALSTIIKNYNFAPLNETFIKACLTDVFSEKEVSSAIKNLTEKKIFFYNKVLKQFELQQGSSVDIDEEINKFREIKLTSKDLVSRVKSYYKNEFIIPKRYNYINKVTRFYKTDLLSVEELKAGKYIDTPDYYREDGLLYYVIPFDQDELELARRLVKENTNQMIVFVLPKSFVECKKDIEELNAINSLFGNKEILNSGHLVKKELQRHKSITLGAIKSVLDPLIGKFNLNADIFYSKIKMRESISSYAELLIKSGEILESEFSQYVVFNNEMINKTKVSGNISLARKQLIDRMKDNASENLLGMEGNGPEVTIFKSMKSMAKLTFDDDKKIFKISKSTKLFELFTGYKDILRQFEDGVSGKSLYDTLVAPPYGLRKGIIPLYLALFDKCLDHPINHYFDTEFIPQPDGAHYDLMVKHPKNCYVKYNEISPAKYEYLALIARVFDDVSPKPTVSSVIESILKWKKSIPEYTKNSGKVSVSEKKILIYIESAKEPDTLIFEKIPEAFDCKTVTDKTQQSDIETIINSLYEAKDTIFQIYPSLVKELHGKLVGAAQFIQESCLSETPVKYTKGMNVAEIIQETLSRLPEDIQKYPFNKLTAKFLGRVRAFEADKHPQYFVETVSDALTESNPRYWAAKGKSLFETNLTKCLNEIEMVTELLDSDFQGQSVVAFINKESGEKDYLRLGVFTEVKEAKIKTQVEALLEELDQKSRNNLLLSLLQRTEDNNESVEVKDIRGKYIE